MALRLDSQLKSEIRRTVKSFNAKIRRLEAKGVTAALLPDKVSSKELQLGFLSRRDLRNRLKQLQDFSSAGVTVESEGGLIGTNILFEYRQGEANKAIQEINKEYEKVLKLDTRYPMMQSEYTSNLRSKMDYLARDIQSMDIRQINIFNKNLLTPEKRTAKDEIFYQNFNRMLFFDAYKANLSPALVARITSKIEKIPPSKLLELHATEPSFKAVSDTYQKGKRESQDVSDEETREQFEALDERLDEILLEVLAE